jgi:hypothetical protein
MKNISQKHNYTIFSQNNAIHKHDYPKQAKQEKEPHNKQQQGKQNSNKTILQNNTAICKFFLRND